METKQNEEKKIPMFASAKENEKGKQRKKESKRDSKGAKPELKMMPIPMRKCDEKLLPPSVIIPSDD